MNMKTLLRASVEFTMRCIQGRLSTFRSNFYPPDTRRAAFLRLGMLLATASLAQSFTHSFASCRSISQLVKESQRLQPTQLFMSLPEGDAEEGGSQNAAATTVGGDNPDQSLWPIRFTKEELDDVKRNSQPTGVDANTRKVLQWISKSCVLIEDGGGDFSHVMAIDAFHDFPMEKSTMVAQEPRLKKPPAFIAESVMDGRDFLRTLLETMYANNRWNDYELTIIMESGDLSINLNQHSTPQHAIDYLDDKMTGPLVQIRSTSPERQTMKFEKDRFTQTAIENAYVKSNRARTIQKFLQGTHQTIKQVKLSHFPGIECPPIRLNYVKRQCCIDEPLPATLAGGPTALDKRRCIVVGGESGSGKTIFAVSSFLDEGYDVFYAVIQSSDYDNKYRPPKDALQTCRDAVQKVIVAINSLADENVIPGRGKQCCLDNLYSAKTCLNQSRNAWARQVAERAWSRVVRNEAQYKLEMWWDGVVQQQDRPRRLALILDEVTNLDLAEGLVDISRDLIAGFERNRSQDRVSLMLCGTGLDDVRSHHRTGTDPTKSTVVIMSEPDFDALQNDKVITPLEKVAIDRGVYGRMLSKNSRMFFQAVLPILKVDILRQPYPFRDNLQEVLIGVTSSWLTMRYAFMVYIESSSIRNLSSMERSEILKDAYLYHLLLGLFDAKTHSSPLLNYSNEIVWLLKHKQVGRLLSLMRTRGKIPERHPALAYEQRGATANVEESNSNPSSDIFVTGLVASKTSPALKFLASRGEMYSLEEQFDGGGFETIVGASLARTMAALGYEVHEVALERAWPYQATQKTCYTTDGIAELKAELGQYGKNATGQDGCGVSKSDSDDNDEVETTSWTSFLRSEKRPCIIFRQMVYGAQGPDLFMLYQCFESGEMLLDSIHAKYHSAPTRNQLAVWFQRIGVTETCMSPEDGRAGWSFAGLVAFRDFVHDQTGLSVELGRRIIASSASAADWQAVLSTFQLANEQQSALAAARIWPKEMFEPMISVLDNCTSAAKVSAWDCALTY